MPRFKKIFVEITNRCNLACAFCQPSSRAAADMTPQAFATVLNRIAGHTDHLCLHLLGEPLLHPQLGELLEQCRFQRKRVNLTTNGTLLAQHGALLLESPALRQLNLSLHSLAAAPPAALAAALDFAREASRGGRLLVSLRLWNHTGADDPVETALLQRLATAYPQAPSLSDGPIPGQGLALAPRLFLSRQPPFVWPHAAVEVGRRGRCRALRDHIGILVDGRVVPCCLDAEGDIVLGNLLSASLDEILATPRAVAMRDGFARHELVEALCRRCNYRLRFSTM